MLFRQPAAIASQQFSSVAFQTDPQITEMAQSAMLLNSASLLCSLLLVNVAAQEGLMIARPNVSFVTRIPNLRAILTVAQHQLPPQSGGTNGYPGLKLRITSKGLTYANAVSARLLNDEIRTLSIPNVEKSFSGGRVSATSMSLTKYTPPTFSFLLGSSAAPLTWRLRGGEIGIKGRWSGKYKKLFTLRGSGSFTASASKIDAAVSASFGRNGAGAPQLRNVRCVANLQISLKIKGGLIGWVLNKFRGKIADKLEPALEKQICDKATRYITRDFNAKLASMPTRKYLGRNFVIDYRLTKDPRVSTSYVEAELKGEIRHRSGGATPFHPHRLRDTTQNSYMLYAWGSDYVVNSWLHHAHKTNVSKFTISERTLPRVARYLQLSCDGICLGTLFPEAGELLPGAKVEAVLQTTNDPTVEFKQGSATARGSGSLKMLLVADGRRMELLSLNVATTTQLRARVVNGEGGARITGELDITELRVSNVQSPLADLGTDEELQALINLATPLIEEQANAELAKGVPVPLTRSLALTNTRLRFLPRTLELATDVRYTA